MSKDETLIPLPQPKPEFRHLSEKEVIRAIQSRSRKNAPIKAEVTRLVEQYVENFKSYIAHNGTEPFLLDIQVQSPIEKVAVRLMIAALEMDKTLRKATLH